MSPDTLHSAFKPVVLLALLVVGAGMVGAAGITDSDGSGTVWLNHDRVELEAICSDAGPAELHFDIVSSAEFTPFTITNESFSYSNGELVTTVETSVFRDNYSVEHTAALELFCDGSSQDTAQIPIQDFTVEKKTAGTGFVGERLGNAGLTDDDVSDDGVTPLVLELDVEGADDMTFDRQDLTFTFKEGYNFGDDLSEDALVIENSDGPDNPDATVTLKPEVLGHFEDFDVNATFSPSETVWASVDIEDPIIYDWKVTELADDDRPGPVIEYDNLGSDYQYDFTITKQNPENEQDYLAADDFSLTVEEREDGDWEPVSDDLDRQKEKLVVEPENDNTYHVELSEIPDVGPGNYRFLLNVDPVNNPGEHFVVDAVRVENTLTFEGRVRDANGGGVKTEMTLSNDLQTIPIVTNRNGRYSKDISNPDNIDSAELRFFYRNPDGSPDAIVDVDHPDLETSSEVGQTSASIGFHYWTEPPIDVPGLNPTDMMAVKFAHEISGADASMAFDPSTIDPTELEVYECDNWNFLGMECLGRWDRMDGNDVSLNYDSWTAHLNDLEEHTVPEDVGGSEKDILLNAYVAGVPSALTLEGDRPLAVTGLESGDRIVAGAEFDVSGNVVTTQGDAVQDANVTLELVGSDGVVDTFDATSGPGGAFTVEAEAPSDTGSYTLHVSLEKGQYTRFDSEDADIPVQTFSVYYTTGLALDMPDLPTLTRGGETTFQVGVQNTGQTTVTGIDLDLSLNGISSQYIDVETPDRLAGGADADATLTVDLPDDFCPDPCNDPPRITLNAHGESDGETVEASGQMFTRVEGGSGTGQDTSEQQDAEQQPDESDGTAFSPGDAVTATGDFIRRQSDVNLALGLILVFTVALAVAVRKRDTGRVMEDRVRHGRISTPQVRPDDRTPPAAPAASTATDASRGAADESADEAEESGKYVCEDTGETFDTKEALELYREINGLDAD